MTRAGVSVDDFHQFIIDFRLQDDQFVREVFEQLMIEPMNSDTPLPVWEEEDADLLLDTLKSPPAAYVDELEPWSPGFTEEVFLSEEIESASLACVQNGEFSSSK